MLKIKSIRTCTTLYVIGQIICRISELKSNLQVTSSNDQISPDGTKIGQRKKARKFLWLYKRWVNKSSNGLYMCGKYIKVGKGNNRARMNASMIY